MKRIYYSRTMLALLLLVSSRILPAQDLKKSTLQIAYTRSTFRFLDKQASPLVYHANLNGIALAYEHTAPKSRRYIKFQAGLGTALPKEHGAREFILSNTDFYGETTTVSVLHAPTLYLGQLEAGYLRRLQVKGNNQLFAGISLQEWIGYSDNIGFWSTWGMNSLALNAVLQYEKSFFPNQKFRIGASLPILALVSRMPYSNSISDPEKGDFRAFFAEGSHLTFVPQYQRINLDAAYQFRLNYHWQVGLAYDFNWQHYSQPRSIRAYQQAVSAQVNYLF
ncbi:hypothetical protein AHMF7605_04145 [Adhaeribacter arboris]|uniref:Uncharacterized protein n=1 Tax=Adhaeribacter arboris TaxID=2072846 RepID=A0A2T2YB95_9BACT|nr:hypothetical protein [Adhaeribacter arboris]PSR52769.1 hypothetical protein AHMF7605_04145 [Adhaeribacter arboris]